MNCLLRYIFNKTSMFNAFSFNTYSTKTEIVEIVNNIDPDEVAHDKPPHLDLNGLRSPYSSVG